MLMITVQDCEDATVAIPVDNIAFIQAIEGITRIWLRAVAGASTNRLWYVETRESVMDITIRLADAGA
jgi:hypothetical protein